MSFLKMADKVLSQKILNSKQTKTQMNPSENTKLQGQRENRTIFQGREEKGYLKEQKSVCHCISYQ